MNIIAALNIIRPTNLPKTKADQSTITIMMNILFVILGAVAVLMIVIAGLRYILSQGDSNKIAESKRMIVYALIGLIVVTLAASIVNVAVKANQ